MAETYTIKPLEWEWLETNLERGYLIASNPFIEGMVYQKHHPETGGWTDVWYVSVDSGMQAVGLLTPEHGKALAEDYWQSYMKQGLIPVKKGES